MQARRWLEAGVRTTRSAGAVGLLPFLLTWLAAACWRDGEWTTGLTHAHAAVDSRRRRAGPPRSPRHWRCWPRWRPAWAWKAPAGSTRHARFAWRGAGLRIVEARAERALGLLELGAGRPELAAVHLRVTAEFALAHGLGSPVLLDWAGDLTEASLRAGAPERARRALAVLEREAAARDGPPRVPSPCAAPPCCARPTATARRPARSSPRHCTGTRAPGSRSRRRAPGCAWVSTCGAAAGPPRPARRSPTLAAASRVWVRSPGWSGPRASCEPPGRARPDRAGPTRGPAWPVPAGRRAPARRGPAQQGPVRREPAELRPAAASPRRCSSPRRSCRWRSSSPPGRRTSRPAPSCSSPRRRSSTTCRTPTASSGSGRGPSSSGRC